MGQQESMRSGIIQWNNGVKAWTIEYNFVAGIIDVRLFKPQPCQHHEAIEILANHGIGSIDAFFGLVILPKGLHFGLGTVYDEMLRIVFIEVPQLIRTRHIFQQIPGVQQIIVPETIIDGDQAQRRTFTRVT